MLRKLAVAASLQLALVSAAAAADLTVTINGARNANGAIAAGIFNGENGFPKPAAAFRIPDQGGDGTGQLHGA